MTKVKGFHQQLVSQDATPYKTPVLTGRKPNVQKDIGKNTSPKNWEDNKSIIHNNA